MLGELQNRLQTALLQQTTKCRQATYSTKIYMST